MSPPACCFWNVYTHGMNILYYVHINIELCLKFLISCHNLKLHLLQQVIKCLHVLSQDKYWAVSTRQSIFIQPSHLNLPRISIRPSSEAQAIMAHADILLLISKSAGLLVYLQYNDFLCIQRQNMMKLWCHLLTDRFPWTAVTAAIVNNTLSYHLSY